MSSSIFDGEIKIVLIKNKNINDSFDDDCDYLFEIPEVRLDSICEDYYPLVLRIMREIN